MQTYVSLCRTIIYSYLFEKCPSSISSQKMLSYTSICAQSIRSSKMYLKMSNFNRRAPLLSSGPVFVRENVWDIELLQETEVGSIFSDKSYFSFQLVMDRISRKDCFLPRKSAPTSPATLFCQLLESLQPSWPDWPLQTQLWSRTLKLTMMMIWMIW